MERGKIDTSIFISEEKKRSLPPIVELKNLRQIFNEGKPNEYRLFDNFNLTIEDTPNKSELISIVGGSGCGKSQILKVIAGLSKVQSGEVKIFGEPRIKVGSIPMVFQTYSNYEWMTVLENVMLPMVIKGIPLSAFGGGKWSPSEMLRQQSFNFHSLMPRPPFCYSL